MDEKKVNIDLKPLTDEEIRQGQFTLKDLWMVQLKGKNPLGPYDTFRLKNYAHQYQFLFEDAKVYNLEEDQWHEMFKVSAFQRRKPQLVSAHNLIKNQEFFILFNGQKEGPYNQEKLQFLLDKGHITTSTQVSLDQGKSWIKLYEHHAFDRRTKKSNQELPYKPNEDILASVNQKKAKIMNKSDARDAIIELAFIGEASTKIQLEKKILAPQKEQTKHNIPQIIKKSKRVKKQKPARNSHRAWKTASVCFSVLLMLGVYVNSKQKNQESFKPMAEVPTQSIGIDNTERTITKRVPASVKNESQNQGQERSLERMKKFKKIRAKRVKPVQKVETLTRPARKSRPKRFAKKEVRDPDFFEQEIEDIDINDPEVQDELSRQLAGEYEDEDMDGGDKDNYDDGGYENDGFDNDYNQGIEPVGADAPMDKSFDDEPQQYDDNNYESYQQTDEQESFDY